MKRQALLVSILLHALLLVGVYVFQGIILPFMRIGGLVPLLLPVVATGVALYEGSYTGGVTGLFAGILCDISFNEPVGTYTVLLTLTGLCIGTLADTVILRGFVTYYLCCTVVLIVTAFVQLFPLLIPLLMLQSAPIPVQAFVSTAVQQTIYSLILALPIWFIVRALGKRAERMPPSRRRL